MYKTTQETYEPPRHVQTTKTHTQSKDLTPQIWTPQIWGVFPWYFRYPAAIGDAKHTTGDGPQHHAEMLSSFFALFCSVHSETGVVCSLRKHKQFLEFCVLSFVLWFSGEWLFASLLHKTTTKPTPPCRNPCAAQDGDVKLYRHENKQTSKGKKQLKNLPQKKEKQHIRIY